MPFTLPPLPYPKDALVPVISAETIDYHYGKHHQAYVTNLNNLTTGTALENASLEELVRTADGGVFNNAAQVWNHTYYWKCLKPAGSAPSGAVLDAIAGAFGSFDAFKELFTKTAVGQFGSGWGWLVVSGGKLAVESTGNAGCPLRDGKTPLLTCDVWEHAYSVDYRNARPKYVEAFWSVVNWDFVAANLAGAR